MTSLFKFGLSLADILAFAFFIFCWLFYVRLVEVLGEKNSSITANVTRYRHAWMQQMAGREVRILDTQINGGLQTGTGFFASTSLFAIGGALTLLGATDKIFDILVDFPLALRPTKLQWELKTFGLVTIYVYAFFKFAWAYRLFNYSSILICATPQVERGEKPDAKTLKAAEKAARMNALAGQQFNRGIRAFFFALGYLGWFLHPYLFVLTTLFVVVVLYQRQFHSEAVRLLRED